MDLIWLMLALASLAIAYMLATFKKYRAHLEKLLAALGQLSAGNVKLHDELAKEQMAKEDDLKKVEESKQQIETNKGRIGELEDKIKNAKELRETLVMKSQSWKLDK